MDIKTILGDFNEKVGTENIYKPTTGNESLHNETNNGIKMNQFAISKGLNVRSPTFPHKDIHKETWYSADRTANYIDHVLISNRFRSAITDIRELRGPDNGSDNKSLKINFKVKLRVKTGNKYKRKIVIVFQNPKWKQEYVKEINNRFEILENMQNEDNIDNNINEKWEITKTIIKETKQQLIEKNQSTETLKNIWYDEKCKIAIEEMKKAIEKWLIKGRREKEEQQYHQYKK